MFYKLYQSNIFMYYLLSKDIIESEIICHLPERKRGFINNSQLVVGSPTTQKKKEHPLPLFVSSQTTK